MSKNRLILLYGLIFLLAAATIKAQVSFTGNELGSEYNNALELFNKEKYAAAIYLFDSFVKNETDKNSIQVINAEYYSAIAAINLFNADAEYRMATFIGKYPEDHRLNEAQFALGNYFYHDKNYSKAVLYFDAVNRQKLENEQLPEYFFRYGYSLYSSGNLDKALEMFAHIKDVDNEYTTPALYYFSQIAYERQMYQTALTGFMKLRNDETFGSIIPFYIVQILYINKDYDGILEMAPALMQSAPQERRIELYRFIGDAHYNKGNYREALPYLERLYETNVSEREDRYQLAYCYYKTGNIDNAIRLFSEIAVRNDLLTQNVWNLLGACYLEKGDKNRARPAFGEASKMLFSKEIAEESLFNYAKLSYETSYSPFGEIIETFTRYIEQYPNSVRIQEATDYLVSAYLEARNYRAALASLDRVANKNQRLEEAYQRVAFFRGLELFSNLELEAAIDMFGKSLIYERYNRPLRARAIYWRGEAWYRISNYNNAKTDYEAFMGIPGITNLDEYRLIRYNLGSALFNIGEYATALNHFRAFETSAGNNQRPEVMADALNRIADCYFIATNYRTAIQYYDRVIAAGIVDVDYAMYQKGFALGLVNDNRGKVDVLTALRTRYPNSAFMPNVIFERGRAYVTLANARNGEADFNAVISDFPNSPFAPRAIVQLGLLYYNMGDNQRAITQYKKVIENYKSTPEARDALTGLRNSYVDINDVEAYFAYVRSVDGIGDVSVSQRDSLTFISGENLYIRNEYARAAEALSNYLNEFSNGSFRLNAKYYLAETYLQLRRKEEALRLFKEISAEPNNQFLEQALMATAGLLFENEDFDEAITYYRRLETVATSDANRLNAIKGELLSASFIGDVQTTINAVNKMTNLPHVPEELLREAIFVRAKAYYSIDRFDDALADFRRVATEVISAEGAESKYRVAELLNRQNRTAEAERTATEFIDMKPPHQYWMARVFLLIADISQKKGDVLQARATLQSLNDYYAIDNDGILDEVKAKLSALN
jgi:TolA-binding protein